MKRKRRINLKNHLRAIVTLALLIGWILAALTGFILWFAPHGQGGGRIAFLLGLNRHKWGDIHFFLSSFALAVTAIHIIFEWRIFQGLIRQALYAFRGRDLL